MPIYEYHCNECDTNFEYLTFGKDVPICPSCNSTKANKLMSTCGFVSKGVGGETVSSSASASSCQSCSANSCSNCGH